MRFLSYVNGVAMQDGKVEREVFPDYTIDIHPNGSTQPLDSNSEPYSDRHIPVGSNVAMDIPECKIAKAALRGERLISAVRFVLAWDCDRRSLTISFRRSAAYKRCELLLSQEFNESN
jgi:starch phosphorylase